MSSIGSPRRPSLRQALTRTSQAAGPLAGPPAEAWPCEGGHCLRHWSSTQPTIALSSGEAELGRISKGLSQGIGLLSIAQDLGFDFSLNVKTDATAAIGMSRRLGVGKTSHLDTSLLWVQQHVRDGDVVLENDLGSLNPADALTKYVTGPELRGHLARMNLEHREGRPESAPQLATSVVASLKTRQKISNENDVLKLHLYPEVPDASYFFPVDITHRACKGYGSVQSVVAKQCGVCEGHLGPLPNSERSPLPRAATGKPGSPSRANLK